MLSCREVSGLVARGDLDGAPRRRRWAVKLHLMMCRHCRRYVAQLRRIAAASREVLSFAAPPRERLAGLEVSILHRCGLTGPSGDSSPSNQDT